MRAAAEAMNSWAQSFGSYRSRMSEDVERVASQCSTDFASAKRELVDMVAATLRAPRPAVRQPDMGTARKGRSSEAFGHVAAAPKPFHVAIADAAAEALGEVGFGTARTAVQAAHEVEAEAGALGSATFPVGFERELAVTLATLCGLSYHCSVDATSPSPDTAPDTPRMAAELEEAGMELVETFRDKAMDTFAFLAREKAPVAVPEGSGPLAGLGLKTLGLESDAAGDEPPARLYLIFRGSVSALNKDLNFDFFRCGYDAAEACLEAEHRDKDSDASGDAAEAAPVLVHRGFLRAWQSLRGEVLASVRAEGEAHARAGRDVELYVTGHSLGGAMAMMASAEIQHAVGKVLPDAGSSPVSLRHVLEHELHTRLRGRKGRTGTLAAHKLYTFAAPRIGNDAFARGFAGAFCKGTNYWAVQSGGDAVPHLPLQAMGFSHPPGRIVTLNKYGRVGVHLDSGHDRLHAWVPRGFNPENWVRTHDILSYGSELADLGRRAAHHP